MAELPIRITLSLILTQPSSIPPNIADQARDVARRWLAPMLDAH